MYILATFLRTAFEWFISRISWAESIINDFLDYIWHGKKYLLPVWVIVMVALMCLVIMPCLIISLVCMIFGAFFEDLSEARNR